VTGQGFAGVHQKIGALRLIIQLGESIHHETPSCAHEFRALDTNDIYAWLHAESQPGLSEPSTF
jgi:hypothetical protein